MNPPFTTAYMGLAIYLWDWIINFRAEYDLLWSHRLCDVRPTQILYFATRYSALPCHIVNIIFQHFRRNAPLPIAIQTCRLWLLFYVVTGGWIFALILAHLMLRVYALYKLDSRTIFAFFLLLSIKVANVFMSWFVFLPTQAFDPVCIPIIERPMELVIFISIELIIQAIPVYLIISRGGKIKKATRARKTVNLVVYLCREGLFSWTATSMVSGTIITIAVATRNTGSKLPEAAYPLFITFLSSLGCQLILQIRRPGRDETSGLDSVSSSSGSPELDLFNSVWDVQSIDYGIEDPALSSGTQEVGIQVVTCSFETEPTDEIPVIKSTEVKS